MNVPPTVRDEQTVSRQLHSLSVRNLAHLATALTQLGFELSRSSDPGTRQAANAFIGQLANINQGTDQQIELPGALDADSVGFRLLDEVQYPDAPEWADAKSMQRVEGVCGPRAAVSRRGADQSS